jgi:hypothetical protein
VPATVVTPVESLDDTASPQNSTDAASLVLFCIHETVHHNKFLFNNQPVALIIQIYSFIKLHVSGIFSAHHQKFSTVRVL